MVSLLKKFGIASVPHSEIIFRTSMRTHISLILDGPVHLAAVLGFIFRIIVSELAYALPHGFGRKYGKKSPHHYLNSFN